MGHALQTSATHACPHCGLEKPTAGFANRNRLGYGIGWCRACQSAAARKWNAAHPKRLKRNQAAYRQRKRAKQRGIQCTPGQ